MRSFTILALVASLIAGSCAHNMKGEVDIVAAVGSNKANVKASSKSKSKGRGRARVHAKASSSSSSKSGSTSKSTADSNSGSKSNSGSSSSSGSNSDSSLTLSSDVLQKASESNGLNASNPAQVASLTSNNNFINFCKGKTITNGLQVKEGSCNGIVMGEIPATSNMVGAKFVFPQNFQSLKAFQDFEVKLSIKGIQTGFFTNPNTNYYAAPQQVNKDGNVIGHTHIVINQISSFTDTTVADPLKFAFFKGIDPAAVGDISSVVVLKGLAPGAYRLCSINTAANHQPVLMPVAQHNANDDCVYFSTKFEGNTKRSHNPRRHHARAAQLEDDE